MCKKGDLKGQTVVFTSLPKSKEPHSFVNQLGGHVVSFPLIQINELTDHDSEFLLQLSSYDWLIFTSQNAVEIFVNKLVRHKIAVTELSLKVAAVGSKTASALKSRGFQVSFIPKTYCADAFIKEFPDHLKETDRCLFLKGSLAKKTIKEALKYVDEWTLYETNPCPTNAAKLAIYLKGNPTAFVTFASPSAVNIFSQYVSSQVNLTKLKLAAIGHVTADCLKKMNLPVHIQAEPYTYLALIDEIANWKDVENK